MPAPNSCRILEGRLLEIDIASGYRVLQDVDYMMAAIAQALARVPERTRVVIAADWRPCKLFTPEVAERVVAMFTRDNVRIERSAILHTADQATSVLQVMRLIRESGHPNRQVFTDTKAMRDFLDQVLNERERTRLTQFLASRT